MYLYKRLKKKKLAIQKFEKTLNNTQTTTQKWTNNGFHNTKKYPSFHINRFALSLTLKQRVTAAEIAC